MWLQGNWFFLKTWTPIWERCNNQNWKSSAGFMKINLTWVFNSIVEIMENSKLNFLSVTRDSHFSFTSYFFLVNLKAITKYVLTKIDEKWNSSSSPIYLFLHFWTFRLKLPIRFWEFETIMLLVLAKIPVFFRSNFTWFVRYCQLWFSGLWW